MNISKYPSPAKQVADEEQGALNRFWLGFLEDGRGGSVVVWDREAPHPDDQKVYLFILKSQRIGLFDRKIVRTKLRALDSLEIKTIGSYAIESYFPALARLWDEIEECQAAYFLESPQRGDSCLECNGTGKGEGGFWGRLECPYCNGTGYDFR